MSSTFFLTGANAKIKLNNKTMAFCTDLSYSITVNVQNPKILGMYESHSMEPVGYSVTGTFSVIRYMSGVKSAVNNPPNGVSEQGNGLGNWGGDDIVSRIGAGNDGRPNEHLNPKLLSTSGMFDVEIYQKVSTQTGTSKNGDPIFSTSLCAVARIRDCRIEKADFSISKTSAAIEQFTFKAAYVDEDTFNADFSGVGHHF